MDAAGGARFEKGRLYTREEIHTVLGGSRRAALVTKGGRIVCLCLTREKNPRAPAEVVIDGDERSVRRARDLAGSGTAVPVFVRAARGGWEYAGERRAGKALDTSGDEGAPAEAARALPLEEIP